MTYRAVEVLRASAVIACEDTRQTRKLLDHFDIRTPLCSFHDHNEASRSGELLDRLNQGECVALVSDAGTPLISDPGFRLVRLAAAAGIRIEPIPGACAALAALAAAGLPTDTFVFGGFLPPKENQRLKRLEELAAMGCTVVLYEAPHRILEALDAIQSVFGDAPLVAGRELTKLHEELLRGDASSVRARLASRDSIKGEFTIVVGEAARRSASLELTIPEAVRDYEARGMSRMEAIKTVAKERGVPKRAVYREVESSDAQ
jgi:16S rRNA (cytidine1402-2'-O)-methyltransferase